jgi:hypothetical protein
MVVNASDGSEWRRARSDGRLTFINGDRTMKNAQDVTRNVEQARLESSRAPRVQMTSRWSSAHAKPQLVFFSWGGTTSRLRR